MNTIYTSGQLVKFTELCEQKGITPEKFQTLLSNGSLAHLLETVALAKNILKDMIAAGHYDWVNSDITEKKFPVPENLVLGTEPKLFHFDCNISSEKAIKEMDEQGFRPATIFDLLDFGAKNPEEQRKYPIAALGSVAEFGGDRGVACLGAGGSYRDLDLYDFGGDWSGHWRFLGVRK